jgi:hypothetical protein
MRSYKLVISGILAWLLLGLTAGLTILTATLLGRNALLQRQVSLSQQLPMGDLLPALTGTSLDGEPIHVDYTSGRSTLLLVFSPTCKFSEANWQTWDTVGAASLSTLDVFFVDIGPVPGAAFLGRHNIPSDRLILQPDQRARYRLKEDD